MNLVILKGRFTRDIELSFTNNQVAIAKGSIAVNDNYKEKENTYFFNVTAFAKTAEMIAEYFGKGKEILITGKLTQNKWTDKEGKDRTSNDIIINSFDFCGKKSDSANNAPSEPQQDTQSNDFPQFDQDDPNDVPF